MILDDLGTNDAQDTTQNKNKNKSAPLLFVVLEDLGKDLAMSTK